MYHRSGNVTLMAENVTRSRSEITVSVSMKAKILKNMIWAKKIIFGTLLHLAAKMWNI